MQTADNNEMQLDLITSHPAITTYDNTPNTQLQVVPLTPASEASSPATPRFLGDITYGELEVLPPLARRDIAARMRDPYFMAGERTEVFFTGSPEDIQNRVEVECQQGHLVRRILEIEFSCVKNPSIDYSQVFKNLRRMERELEHVLQSPDRISLNERRDFIRPYFQNPSSKDCSNTFDHGDISRLYKICLILKFLSERFTMIETPEDHLEHFQLAHALTHHEILGEHFKALFMHLAAKNGIALGTVSFNGIFHMTDLRGRYVLTSTRRDGKISPWLQRFTSFNRTRQVEPPSPRGLGVACLKLFFRNILYSTQYQSLHMIRYWTTLAECTLPIFFAAEESVTRGEYLIALAHYEKLVAAGAAHCHYYRRDRLADFERGIAQLYPDVLERAASVVSAIQNPSP